MTEQLKQRNQVDQKLKWNLSGIFETPEEFQTALEELPKNVKRFSDSFKGELNDTTTVISAFQEFEALSAKLDHVSQYSYLPVSVDITDGDAQETARNVAAIVAELSAELSFFDSEVKELPDNLLEEVAKEAPEYKPFVREIKKGKKQKLPPEVEKALANLSPVLNSFEEIYEQARSADADFGSFEVDGKRYPLSFVTYEDFYMYHEDPKIRRASYDKFNEVLGQYKNSIATAYYTQVHKEKIISTMRGYDSVFDYLLENQDVDQELYHRQIDMIMNDFAPVMRKYISHVKEQQGLDKMTYADLKIDLDPKYATTLSIEESKNLVKNALAPLGEDYVNMILRAYPEGWIDFAQNVGKRSGAFCSVTYGKHPYVMLSWSDLLSDGYTLLHELGHAGQGILSNENNVMTAAEPSLYLVEAPSTFNELLLSDYLLKNTDEPRMERAVLSTMISKTYFHNFVTHLLEAAYQREVYRLVDAGKGFDANILSGLKRRVLEDFWGEAIEIESGAELTWMRQVHYYMGLYPYTYLAGLTIATQAFLKIKRGESDVSNWIEFLALGGSKSPVEAAKVANVDIETEQALSDTILYLDESIDRMIELSSQI